MGVYIPGVEMPRSCYECSHSDEFENICKITGGGCVWYNERPPHCPIVHVPPHGDLIDRDGLDCLSWKVDEVDDSFDAGVLFVLERADELPTIIPAEEAET